MFARLALFLALFLAFSPCFADTELEGVPQAHLENNLKFKDTWSIHLSPYIWLASLSGHVNIRANRVAFNDSFSRMLHYLDFSLGAHFEAYRGPWSLMLDPDYVKITQKPGLRFSNSKTTYETTITDAGVYYSIYSLPSPKADLKRASLELLGAGRIVTFHTTIDSPALRIPPSISDTSSIVVPILGARFKYNFNPKLHTWLGGDFGGFQVSHVSSTWSSIIGLQYNFTDFFDLSLAYKAMGVNYSIRGITINTLLQGPILACGFSW
jgi:hypothetical protein